MILPLYKVSEYSLVLVLLFSHEDENKEKNAGNGVCKTLFEFTRPVHWSKCHSIGVEGSCQSLPFFLLFLSMTLRRRVKLRLEGLYMNKFEGRR